MRKHPPADCVRAASASPRPTSRRDASRTRAARRRPDHAGASWAHAAGTSYPAPARHAGTRRRSVAATQEHALALLNLLAEAEAKVHGTTVDHVHFHELADWDSLLDLVAAGCIAGALRGRALDGVGAPVGRRLRADGPRPVAGAGAGHRGAAHRLSLARRRRRRRARDPHRRGDPAPPRARHGVRVAARRGSPAQRRVRRGHAPAAGHSQHGARAGVRAQRGRRVGDRRGGGASSSTSTT